MQCGVGAICTGADSSGVHNSLHTRLALLLSSATAGDFTDAGTESASFKTLFWGMLAMKASQQWPCRTPSTLTAYRTPLDVIQVFLISLRYKLCQPATAPVALVTWRWPASVSSNVAEAVPGLTAASLPPTHTGHVRPGLITTGRSAATSTPVKCVSGDSLVTANAKSTTVQTRERSRVLYSKMNVLNGHSTVTDSLR